MQSEPAGNASHERRLDEIVTAYLKAVEAGEHPDPNVWVERHPDLATELNAFFAAQREVAALAGGRSSGAVETIGLEGGKPTSAPTKVRYFGDYELLKEIARGGMGVVFRARQVSLNRVVALKMILKGELATERDVARFKVEAEAAASLDHPHIVPIY